MDRGRLVKMSLMAAAALLISACAGSPTKQLALSRDKVAVVNWQRATEAHPEYKKLEQGRKVLKDLLEKRKSQEGLAKAQLGSLEKLRALRRLSENGYRDADVYTHMVEFREIENARFQKLAAAAEAETDAELAPRKKAVEDSYQLEIFNLRALLESVKMRTEDREAVEQKLKGIQHERGQKIMELQAEKKKLLEARLVPLREQMQQRIAAALADYQQKQLAQQQDKDAREQEMLSAAPKALHNALTIMDREIDKQQEKNDQLQKSIDSDISSQAVRLAHERGYTIVFNKFKVNISAEDITDKVVENLRKQDKK